MKKTTANNILPIMALFAAAVATSCSSDSLVTDGNSGNGEVKSVTLTAKVNDNDATTRVGMNKEDGDAVSFYWHSNDAILVQTVRNGAYSGAEFTTETATGEASAEFTGTIKSENSLGTYAVYPYSDKHSFTSATALTYNLPAKYEYSTVESGIFSKTDGTGTTYRSTSTNIPMVGTVTDDAIEFKHIGGLAVIRIDEMPAMEGTLTVTADQQLCGDFTIADLSADEPKIVTTSSYYNNKVTFNFSGASTANEAGVFYLPLATGNYTNVKITIAYGESNSTTQTIPYGSLSVARQSVTAIPLSTDSKGNLRYIVKNSDGSYIINGHKFVDLGLSVLWAETNIGAGNAEDYGDYYAWGEVIAYDEQTTSGKKTDYSWSTYKWTTTTDGSSFTKYTTNGKTVLDKEDDAAYVNWGSSCRMPTKDEFDELTNTANCNWAWSSDKKGSTVTSQKTNYTNNSIFLPASGCRDEDFYGQGNDGGCWSSSLYPDNSNSAYTLYFHSGDQYSYGDYRYVGYAVRPVAEK